MSKKLNYEYCRAAPVLEWMGQKWALVTLLRMKEASEAAAQGGEIRFSDLFRTIPQISEKMLASTLDYLEQEGLVNRIAQATSRRMWHTALRPSPITSCERSVTSLNGGNSIMRKSYKAGKRPMCAKRDIYALFRLK